MRLKHHKIVCPFYPVCAWVTNKSENVKIKKDRKMCIRDRLYAYPAIFAMKGFSSSQFLLENDSSFFAKLIRVPSAVTMWKTYRPYWVISYLTKILIKRRYLCLIEKPPETGGFSICLLYTSSSVRRTLIRTFSSFI